MSDLGDVLDLDLGDAMSDAIEDAGKPNLLEGYYLAVVSEAKKHIGTDDKEVGDGTIGKSIGFKHTLLVNPLTWSGSKADVQLEWVPTETMTPVKDYSFLGYVVDGAIRYRPTNANPAGRPGWQAVNWIIALGLFKDGRPTYNEEAALNKVVIVKIVHVPSDNDPDTLYANAYTVYPVIIENEDGDQVTAPSLKELPVALNDDED